MKKNRRLRKKMLSVFLAAMMTLAVVPFSSAQSADEIMISTAQQLISLSHSTDKADFSKNYRLANDIDMSQAEDARPMKAIGSYTGGSNDIAFNGTFDGDGYKIINLSITDEALFGYVGESGAIKNLTLEKASVHYSQQNSSKYPAAFAALNRGRIERCFTINSAVVSDYCSPAGGFVGTNFGTVTQCGVSGGTVSFAEGKFGTSHGGFVGNQRGGSIEECFSTASVEAQKWAGGFAGKIEDGTITDCYTRGTVTGTDENGGFAGAYMDPAAVKNVYAANEVSASSGGGIAGGKGGTFTSAGVPENSYYCSDCSLPVNSGAFENSAEWEKSAAEMHSAEFAAMLSDKWAYDANINDGYPYLINAAPPVSDDNAERVTVQVMLVDYDKDNYEFYQLSEPFEVTVRQNTVTVEDVLETAANSGSLTYSFGVNAQSGQIVTINDITPKSPNGWLFSVNDIVSPVGVGSAIVSDGDKILWYVGTPENGYTPPMWESVGETAGEFIFIGTAEELAELSQAPERWNRNYKLSNDIDLSGVVFTPVGNGEIPFTGIFDGNGFEISNMTVMGDKDSRNIGMFGVVRGAKLKNITLKNADITGGSVVGGLVGIAQVNAEEKNISLISDCHVSGKVTAIGTSYAKQTDAGGLIGVNDSAENLSSGSVFASAIDNCSADVMVTGSTGGADISEAGHIGGLVGLNKGIVSNSSAKGEVLGGNTTGGFVGSNFGGSIYFSSAAGKVSGAYTAGGFAGSTGAYSLIENSYSTGDVIALGENGANYGGFAGAVSGKVKNCVSSGTLTKGWSYNGGFAGRFDGTIWSYNDDLRSISNCYGNTVTSCGDVVKPLGDYIGGVHAPTDLAAQEIGVDKETAEKKIEEMLNNILDENKLVNEAKKYRTIAAIPATVQENSDITSLVARLNTNTSADSEIKLSYKAESQTIAANSLGYTLCSKPEKDTKETVILSLSLNDVAYEQPLTVTLLSSAKDADADKLLNNIAKRFAESDSDYWKTVIVSAYHKYFDGEELTEEARTGFVKNAVRSIAETDEDTTLAMNIIALRSLGYDPARITAEDGTQSNAVEKLAASQSAGNNGDAYRLLAYKVCGYENQSDTERVISRLLTNQIDNNGWSSGNDDSVDGDTTGAVLLGLSAYYNTSPAVKSAVDGAVTYLSSLVQPDGNIKSSYKQSNYGTNANTSAICAIGLEALGIDIKSDERFKKNSVSLFDGIMSFASEDESGFVYEYTSAEPNDLATKQAALAVMAAEKKGNILDFSDMPNRAINLQETDNSKPGSSGGTVSGGKSDYAGWSDSTKNAEVTVTLIGDTVHGTDKHSSFEEWLKDVKLTVVENTTAREVIEKVLRENGYTVKGLDRGYITEIITPDGIILGEYSNGAQSGWMYSVNDESPTVGINDYRVKNGDRIKVYYSDSWQTNAFPDVSSDDWFFEAAEFAAQNNLIQGNENGEFMPNESLTRAMAVTILYRYMGGEEITSAASVFFDVPQNEWFAAAVGWAAANKVVSGVGEGMFEPHRNITREELALILYRLSENGEKGILEDFGDKDEVSDWANDAMRWAVGTQLISGTEERKLEPQNTATRAEFAIILMRLSNLIYK